MIDELNAFIDELKAVGLPISLTDRISAFEALKLDSLETRSGVEAALATTLVKRREHLGAFRAIFDIYFSTGLGVPEARADGPAALHLLTPEALAMLALRSVAEHDHTLIRLVAKEAVSRYAGFQPGRAVGGTYYVIRTLRLLDFARVGEALQVTTAEALADGHLDALGAHLSRGADEASLQRFRTEVESEVRRLIAADRGAPALARTLRKPLPEDLDFTHASGNEVDEIRSVIEPLSRRLAASLGRSRRDSRRASLNFRTTITRSLAYGGLPAELHYHPPHVVKPELVVVADISGSVASFARFTLQLLFALASQFSTVRSFVFVDGLVEVTDLLKDAADLDAVVARVNEQTEVLWLDGHSDYGHAFRTLAERWGGQFSRRSNVIVLGDARNNYHAPEAESFARVASEVGRVAWLNPEPRTSWDTGDSVMSAYAPYCNTVVECRTVSQLREFVNSLA